MRESAERGGPLPRVVVGAPVVLLFVFIFVVALAHDRGALVEPGGGRSLFRTRLAMASVVEQIPLAETASVSAMLIMHGLMTASIIVFLAALGRRRHRDFFGSRRRLKALLFCFSQNGHQCGICALGEPSLWSGVVGDQRPYIAGYGLCLRQRGYATLPLALEKSSIFLGNYKHIPVAGYSMAAYFQSWSSASPSSTSIQACLARRALESRQCTGHGACSESTPHHHKRPGLCLEGGKSTR